MGRRPDITARREAGGLATQPAQRLSWRLICARVGDSGHRSRAVMGLAVFLLIAGCGVEPLVSPGEAPPDTVEEESPPAGSPGEPEEVDGGPAIGEHAAWVPVLSVDVLTEWDGSSPEAPALRWFFVPPDQHPPGLADEGVGTARLWSTDGELLAEGPVERFEMWPDCEPGASCEPQAGLDGLLLVPRGAERAGRLEVVVEGEVLVEVARGPDVGFTAIDAPPSGEVTPPLTVAWTATSGEVSARLIAEPGVPVSRRATSLLIDGPPEGALELEAQHLYPAAGAVLELVVVDGLAFERVVAGPYRSGVPLDVEWLVIADTGEPLEELGRIDHDPRQWNYLSLEVDVLVRLPGEDLSSGVHDVQARWVSDRDGDLAEINLEAAPSLYIPSGSLSRGAHTLTLHLQVEGVDGPATHEIQVELHVAD